MLLNRMWLAAWAYITTAVTATTTAIGQQSGRAACDAISMRVPETLREHKHIALKAGTRPILVAGNHRLTAVVSEGDVSLRVFRGTRRWAKTLPDSMRPVGISVEADSIVELLDARTNSVYRYGILSNRVTRRPLKTLPIRPRTATKAMNNWYVGGMDGRDYFTLFRYSANAIHRVLALPPGPLGVPPMSNLSTTRDGIIVTEMRSPYRAYVINGDGRVARSFSITDARLAGGAMERWVSMPLLRLGDGYLVTLTDPRSDARMMVSLNNEGRVVRVRSLLAPMALTRLSDDGRWILGVRQAASPQIVLYGCMNGAEEEPE